MPGGDGTGPLGQGPGIGQRSGLGRGRGRMDGTNSGAGPGGYCMCVKCGTKVPHDVGKPCYSTICPNCGARMARQ